VIPIAPGIDIEERDLKERFIRASGPGGQNVNKVATAVELRFDLAGSSLPQEVKDRLYLLAANRISEKGLLLIDSRAFRTQLQNREAARERLIALLRRAAVRPKQRRATRPKAGARERRLESKKRRGEVKNLRSSKDQD
jgi:ribosome-associated protein